jgi:DNA-binding MarR family transcriptional regulator
LGKENALFKRDPVLSHYIVNKEITSYFNFILDKYNITITQYLVLRLLMQEKESNMKMLGEALNLDSGTLTPLLKRIEENGLVGRKNAQHDARKIIFYITSKGMDVIQSASREISTATTELKHDFTKMYDVIGKIHSLKSKKWRKGDGHMRNIRIYAEVKEQGLFFKEAIQSVLKDAKIELVLTNSVMLHYSDVSIISLIRNQKKFDLLVSEIKDEQEIPVVMVEFSTAVNTDDHELQRADAMFWAYKYKIPYLKIAPTEKKSQTAHDNFGGGTLLSVNDQIIYMYRADGVMYHIDWISMENSAYVKNAELYPSCPDCAEELISLFKQLFWAIDKCENREEYYKLLLNELGKQKVALKWGNTQEEKTLEQWKQEEFDLLERFSEYSSRLEYNKNKKELKIKVNRYGHAMDPERGMLAFWKLVLGDEWKIIAEFQLQRETLNGRKSYQSLFDGVSQEEKLMDIANEVVKRGNIISPDKAIEIHKLATSSGIINTIDMNTPKYKYISDYSLRKYLQNGLITNIYKNLLYYVDEIRFTNLQRNTIASLTWNKDIVNTYYQTLLDKLDKNLTVLPLTFVDKSSINEDLVTWGSKEILVSLGYKILAVSYPGAQGDRCVLVGPGGKKVKRKYIDLIAISPEGKGVILLESKEKLANSKKDVDKMKDLLETNEDKVKDLINVLNIDNYNYRKIYTGVAGQIGGKVNKLSVDITIQFEYDTKNQQLNWKLESAEDILGNRSGSLSIKDIAVVKKRK